MEGKAYQLGTHRTTTPEETLARLQPILQQMGITRVANVTGLDRVGIPVYNAFRPESLSISVSQGKGSEPLAAKVSAIMESVESYHAERLTAATRFGSIHELSGHVDLADVYNMPRAGSRVLLENDEINWVSASNLYDDQVYWLPLELVSTDYSLPQARGSGYFAANTNGLASGNSFKEALCHAIYEVVERDAEALWSQRSPGFQATTGVDSESIEDSNCRWLLEQFSAAGIKVLIWDLTSDVGLPCYTCLAMGNEHDWADPEFGTGCHATKEIALARALTEAAQARATFIAGSRDDVGLSEYRQNNRSKRRAQGIRQMRAHQATLNFAQLPSQYNRHIEDDLQLCLQRLAEVGIRQVLAVDLRLPAFELPVVKVVIPGLEGAYGHWHGAYVPGQRAKAMLNLPFDIYTAAQ